MSGVVAAGIALTAGAGVTAAQLGLPPFQGIPPSLERLTAPVPLEYIDEDGDAVSCQAFLEFENLDAATRSDLENGVQDHDWSGVGQDAYDASPSADAGDADFIARLEPLLFAEAQRFVPQLTEEPGGSSAVSFSGYSMSCTTQNR